MKVSCFPDIRSANNPSDTNAIKLLESFREDKYKIDVNRTKQKANFGEFKKTLPIACFGGTFSKRSRNSLVKSSGLLTLDFDNVQDLQKKKNELKKLPYMLSVFISPSGRGLKAIVRTPIVKDDKEYKKIFNALKTSLNGLDESGKDISRACFFSYDPDIYINPDATVYTQQQETTQFDKKQLKRNDYQLAGRVLRIIQNAIEGERHTKILNASRLMGGYVEAKKISYDEAVRLLEQEAYQIDPEDYQTNKRAIYDGLEDGMKNPLPKDNLDSTLSKEELEHELGKIYYTIEDCDDEINQKWNEGRQRGYDIGFSDDKISIKEGCTTYIYAAPYMGKTQFLFEILINLSCKYDLKHVLFSSESGTSADVYIELMECFIGSDFYNTYNNRMSEDQKNKARDFVGANFIVIDPQDGILTPEDFYNYVDIIERVYECKVFSATIDPWNELLHDFSKDNGRQDMYIERQLGMVRKNAQKTQRHNFIVTHVQDQQLAYQDQGQGKKVSYYPYSDL